MSGRYMIPHGVHVIVMLLAIHIHPKQLVDGFFFQCFMAYIPRFPSRRPLVKSVGEKDAE